MPNDTTPMKRCSRCKQESPATTEFFHRDKGGKNGFASRCKECRAETARRYYIVNQKKVAEQEIRYRGANREKVAERHRRYRQANREKYRVLYQRREARKRSLPDTFTDEQWLQCLEYHNYCCPVCDSQLRDLFGDIEPHADHWIPLSYEGDDNPGTVATNMICLCNTCNLSKNATMPTIWLEREYGTRKANETMARIEAYFEWVVAQGA